MKTITQHYIGGEFVDSVGQEKFNLYNPVTAEVIGTVTLGSEIDARRAISAAKEAFKTYSKTTVEQRAEYLQRLHDEIMRRFDDHLQAFILEFGGPTQMGQFQVKMAAEGLLAVMEDMKTCPFKEIVDGLEVTMHPIGVTGQIIPWNGNLFQFCGKVGVALASGCTTVVKPSEMSAIQTQVIMETVHSAKLPPGVINIVNGLGDEVGKEISKNPDVAKISFTGSTLVGKTILRRSASSLKRVNLELGGKSAHIIMDDADLAKAIPFALTVAWQNSGQACVAGSRLLVPEAQLEVIKGALQTTVPHFKVGLPALPDTVIGPLVSQKQWDRVQNYIKIGIEEGAEILVGGPGHPDGLEKGYFVKPTIFVNVKNSMTIAREEIFGPVLCVLTYKTLEEAVEIANDSHYGLAGYVSGKNVEKAKEIAGQMDTGVVFVNELRVSMKAPFGGFKESGIGREGGIYGIRNYMEYKSVMA